MIPLDIAETRLLDFEEWLTQSSPRMLKERTPRSDMDDINDEMRERQRQTINDLDTLDNILIEIITELTTAKELLINKKVKEAEELIKLRSHQL